jgi:hypothetical protein
MQTKADRRSGQEPGQAPADLGKVAARMMAGPDGARV